MLELVSWGIFLGCFTNIKTISLNSLTNTEMKTDVFWNLSEGSRVRLGEVSRKALRGCMVGQ